MSDFIKKAAKKKIDQIVLEKNPSETGEDEHKQQQKHQQ